MKLIRFYFLTAVILLVLASLCFAQQDKNRTNKPENNKAQITVAGIKVVKAIKDDTVESLAKRYKVSATDVAKLNGLFIKSRLNEGREIRIPVNTDRNERTQIESNSTNKGEKQSRDINILNSRYKIVRSKLNDTVETLACRYNVLPEDIIELNPPSKIDLAKSKERLSSGTDFFGKLDRNSRLELDQEIRIPLEQNYSCVSQISA